MQKNVNDISQRIRRFAEYSRMSVSEFERQCGFSKAYVSHIRRNISNEACTRIAQRFPQLSLDWLLRGEGYMLNIDKKSIEEPERKRLQEMVDVRDARIYLLEEGIRELIDKMNLLLAMKPQQNNIE